MTTSLVKRRQTVMHRRVAISLLALLVIGAAPQAVLAAGKLLLRVTESKDGAPIPFRLHLKNAKGVAVKTPPLPFWHDHVVAAGALPLELPRGNYFFEIEHGPEFEYATGHFTINDGADDEKTVVLRRAADMAAAGWWSGDIDVRRPTRDIEPALQADDLHLACVATWTNRKSEWLKTPPPALPIIPFDADRYYHLTAGLDDRNGGPIAILNLSRPMPLPAGRQTLAALVPDLNALKAENPAMWFDVAHPAAWDLPILLALAPVDSIRVLPPTLERGKINAAPFGKPFDRSTYVGDEAPARFAQDVYFHALNSGLRIAPSAGSASGVVANPVGYGRVYVPVPVAQFNYETWWAAYKSGQAVVTNGPVMRATANGEPPGKVFRAAAGEKVALEIALSLTTRDPIDYIEIIHNGRTARSVPLREWVGNNGRIAPVEFAESGWCLVRAQCRAEKTYRATLSAPWYVEIGGRPHVSRASVQFFLDWLEERAASLKIAEAAEAEIVAGQIDAARRFWQEKLSSADAP